MKQVKKIVAAICVSSSILMTACADRKTEWPVNVSAAYEKIINHIEPWKLQDPLMKDDANHVESLFVMEFKREEGVRAIKRCEQEKVQKMFESCVIKEYDNEHVEPTNLRKYVESPAYSKFKEHPELRKVLDKVKRDDVITNDEFYEVIKQTQVLLNNEIKIQYQNQIKNL